jgi:hypothetical protein
VEKDGPGPILPPAPAKRGIRHENLPFFTFSQKGVGSRVKADTMRKMGGSEPFSGFPKCPKISPNTPKYPRAAAAVSATALKRIPCGALSATFGRAVGDMPILSGSCSRTLSAVRSVPPLRGPSGRLPPPPKKNKQINKNCGAPELLERMNAAW